MLKIKLISKFQKKYQLVLVLIALFLIGTESVFPKDKKGFYIPNVDLKIAARENREPLDQGIHLFKIYCGLGACQISQLSLNECRPYRDNGMAFIPFYFAWATWLGTLEVTEASSDTLKITVFEGSHRTLPAYFSVSFVPDQPFAKKITNFEAKGFRKAGTTEKIDYVPISGPSHPEQLDCPLLVPGLEN